jgi:undecaprenyl pyrophosphate phosphatase UppP
MSIPIIIGATLLEFIEAENTTAVLETYSMVELLVAMFVTAFVGCLAIKLLVKTLVNRKFWIFGIYCFVVAITSLAVALLG